MTFPGEIPFPVQSSGACCTSRYRTIFGLVVSLKLFLGRFDMRTMQVQPIALQSMQLARLFRSGACIPQPLGSALLHVGAAFQ